MTPSRIGLFLAIVLAAPSIARAQTTFTVQRNITINGGGFSLSGNNQYRGLFVAAFVANTATPQGVSVTIQNLTIQNTRAAGGDGGTGAQSLSLEAAALAEHSQQADVRLNAFRHTGGIRPHVSVSYRRELGDADTTTDVQFTEKPESGFAVEGLGFGKDTTTRRGA
jgi:hypothetical protein